MLRISGRALNGGNVGRLLSNESTRFGTAISRLGGRPTSAVGDRMMAMTMLTTTGTTRRGVSHLVVSNNAVLPPLAVMMPARFKSTLPPPSSSSASLSSSATPDKSNKKDDGTTAAAPPTLMQRMRAFPQGVKELYRDCMLYRHIQDAADTPINAWTQTGVPRRAFQQQRQLRADVSAMLPLILLYIPPIVGFIPPLLAAFCPRQVLTRHFHNDFEIRAYAEQESRQRMASYEGLAQCIPMSSPHDAVRLYRTVFAASADHDRVRSVQALSRDHLIHLSLSIGIHQHLPHWMSTTLNQSSPSWYLRQHIARVGQMVTQDDAILLQEGYDNLTDIEVMDACLMRGLPIDASMRESLRDHLETIAAVRQEAELDEAFRLFTLHLAPLRAAWQRRTS